MSLLSTQTLSNMLPQVVTALLDKIKGQNGLVQPVELVGFGMQFVERFSNLTGAEKKELFIKALSKIAAGKDGEVGTEDDVIPTPIVENIKIMLDHHFVDQIIDLVADVSKGKFNINTVEAVATDAVKSGCFGCFKSS